ncbi:MAG TPA: thiamine pyrophosphate-dependent enzyme, partial [Cyclobacteriaceae bacterium]
MTQVKNVKSNISAKRATAILADYQLACESREASLLGRKEVFMGKAKFGIFGDGKEVAQIAMAKVFRKGDFRSGYYRDQTFMFAIGELTLQEYFAQLYAHTEVHADPASAGRLMNGHFATRMIDEEGDFKNLTKQKNSSSDISPTAGQMPRLVGLGYASKLFRNNPRLASYKNLSINGNEVAFGTIGNASTSEGIFFEAINAAGVLQIPMLMSVWDDDYGISVPAKYQTTKGSISKILQGFQRSESEKGFEIITAKGWDYDGLCKAYVTAERICREEHVPVLLHVLEMTQPQGHSTSGSHERYKSKDRLDWEKNYDCILRMRQWILKLEIASTDELGSIETHAKATAKSAKESAWKEFNKDIQESNGALIAILSKLSSDKPVIQNILRDLKTTINPLRLDGVKAAKHAIRELRGEESEARNELVAWIRKNEEDNWERYSSHLYSQSQQSALKVERIAATYSDSSSLVDGREILQACFDEALERDPTIFALGEDVGQIGDVNQAFAGLQTKYGELRVTDTGIREATIIGQGIGAALRG